MKININKVVEMCIKRKLSVSEILLTATICRSICFECNIDRLLKLAFSLM
nr:MAG TPA: hypothetical protein [Caudoviricetes sp.]